MCDYLKTKKYKTKKIQEILWYWDLDNSWDYLNFGYKVDSKFVAIMFFENESNLVPFVFFFICIINLGESLQKLRFQIICLLMSCLWKEIVFIFQKFFYYFFVQIQIFLHLIIPISFIFTSFLFRKRLMDQYQNFHLS